MSASTLQLQIDRSLRVAVGMATEYVLSAAQEVGDEIGRPVMVIASRRQVDNAGSGGGYVGWTTPEWCARARSRDSAGSLLLARDHGGPYQHPRDVRQVADVSAAMALALESLRCDIESGVELLHIDSSLGPGGVAEAAQAARERALELTARCVEIAVAAGRQVAFEIGIEVQNGDIADVGEYADQMGLLLRELRRECGVSPAFLVAQTGTKVAGRHNTGIIQHQHRSRSYQRRLRDLAAVIRSFGSRLKAHNCDYLSDRAARQIHMADAWMNVSPEIGSAQTIAVVRAARAAELGAALDEFCSASITAGYWRKWAGAQDLVTDDEKIVLGGSYLFSTPTFAELRQRLDHALGGQGRSTRRIAIEATKTVMRRYDRDMQAPTPRSTARRAISDKVQ